jgi:hypothetical protein
MGAGPKVLPQIRWFLKTYLSPTPRQAWPLLCLMHLPGALTEMQLFLDPSTSVGQASRCMVYGANPEEVGLFIRRIQSGYHQMCVDSSVDWKAALCCHPVPGARCIPSKQFLLRSWPHVGP